MSDADKRAGIEALEAIITAQQQQAYQVRTREEEAQQQQNQQLLSQVAGYTSDAIVRGLANLQLEFETQVSQLGDRLQGEVEKQGQLQQAIILARQQQQQLHQIGIVADGLYSLRREQAQKQRQLHDAIAQALEELESHQEQTRKQWQRQQQQQQENWEAKRQQRQKQRQQQEADAAYEQQQRRQRDADEYGRILREQQHQLSQQDYQKQKDWEVREAVLTANQEKISAYREQVAQMETSLQESFNQAKTEAIREVHQQSRSRRELLEKTWEGQQQGYEVKLESLQESLAQYDAQLAEISQQLQAARDQARSLSVQAFS